MDQLSPITITFEQAIELLKQPKRRGGRSSQPTNLREVGKHPLTEAPLVIKSGRYGPYVTDGKVNASLPRGADPAGLSVQDAVNLLDARVAKMASEEGLPKKRGGRAKKAPKQETSAAPKKKRAKKE
jgi:DNA topoisomerase-1